MDTNRYSTIVRKWHPAAGLVGTIFGMLRSFQHIAHAPNEPCFCNVVRYMGEGWLLSNALLLFVTAFAVIATASRK